MTPRENYRGSHRLQLTTPARTSAAGGRTPGCRRRSPPRSSGASSTAQRPARNPHRGLPRLGPDLDDRRHLHRDRRRGSGIVTDARPSRRRHPDPARTHTLRSPSARPPDGSANGRSRGPGGGRRPGASRDDPDRRGGRPAEGAAKSSRPGRWSGRTTGSGSFWPTAPLPRSGPSRRAEAGRENHRSGPRRPTRSGTPWGPANGGSPSSFTALEERTTRGGVRELLRAFVEAAALVQRAGVRHDRGPRSEAAGRGRAYGSDAGRFQGEDPATAHR